MGLNLKDLVVREKTTLESFASRIIAIDAYNALYQFLATIRGYDGAQLADSQGAVTSHLSGLFYRNINFLSLGIRPVYVFDGKPPSMKSAEIMRRKKSLQSKFDADGSYMHRTSHDAEVMDEARSKDIKGNPIIKAKPKLSLYDVEYKLDGMVVVPVDKNTGKSLDEKQLEVMNKQLGNLWLLHDED